MTNNAVDHVTIRGFKSIASLERLELRPINILIGANGAGKSNFIGAFELLQRAWENRLTLFFAKQGGANRVFHFGTKNTRQITVQFSASQGQAIYRLVLEPGKGDSIVLADEEMKYPMASFRPSEANQGELVVLTKLDGAGWRVYHFHDTGDTSPMKRTAKVDDNRFLRSDGSNLASFLYYLRKSQPDAYRAIVRTVQRVAPFLFEFQLEPMLLSPSDIRLEWKHRSSDQFFDVSSLSDGTLRFIALAGLLLQPKELRPSMILVDEPELGLHPYAIGLLASMIKQAAVDTQVIVATQSPILLDYFEPEDVLVADCVDGATAIKRLDAEPLAEWLEDYSLGQLWEKNEIGGLPGSM